MHSTTESERYHARRFARAVQAERYSAAELAQAMAELTPHATADHYADDTAPTFRGMRLA